MKKPVLVIMAAGMGSRYGGLKQIDPVDEFGNIIMDFSVFDALRAGFEEVVFLIKHQIESDFKAAIGNRLSSVLKVDYAFQEFSEIPADVILPKGRIKPLGTTHAVICANSAIRNRPFAVINADDYYGPDAFARLFSFLTSEHDPDCHMAVGYPVENTLTDNGSVTRGVCVVDESGYLKSISECKGIVKKGSGAAFTVDGHETAIPKGTTVSMNCWAFNPGILPRLESRFKRNLAAGLERDPMKYEDLLPTAVCEFLNEGHTRVTVSSAADSWFGVTYKEDKPQVMNNIRKLKEQGLYPEKLWQ